MICKGCSGKGMRVPFFSSRVETCSECGGKGKVPDFCYVSVDRNGRATYRAVGFGGEPWRYNLEGARNYAEGIRRGSATHKPNAVIRVYLK